MSPGVLALFSYRGVDRVWFDGRRKCFNPHRCRPKCGREMGWSCGWVYFMERPL